MWGISAEQWIAIAAACQVLFSGFLLYVVWRQKDISSRQANIMEAQKELTRKVDEFQTGIAILEERYNLSDKLRIFWDGLDSIHNRLYNQREIETDQLDELLKNEGWPPNFMPSTARDLKQFIDDQIAHHRDELGGLWLLARKACSGFHPVLDNVDDDAFREAWGEIAYFWHKWSSLPVDIHEYLMPDWKELVMLTWLELAFHFSKFFPEKKRAPGILGRKFFEFAEAEWKFSQDSFS